MRVYYLLAVVTLMAFSFAAAPDAAAQCTACATHCGQTITCTSASGSSFTAFCNCATTAPTAAPTATTAQTTAPTPAPTIAPSSPGNAAGVVTPTATPTP